MVVDVPKDVTANVGEYRVPQQRQDALLPADREQGHPGQIKRAAKLMLGNSEADDLHRRRRDSGRRACRSELTVRFARLLGYPITNTLMGLGAYPGTDPQFVGMLGMHGTYEANMAMHDCDVLIAVGARFDDRVTGDLEKFCPGTRIIHVDIDPSSISKNVPVDVPIVGAVGNRARPT